MPTKSFKIQLPLSTIEQLEQSARRFRRRSGNQVATEIIEQYIDFWCQAEQARADVVQQQRLALDSATDKKRRSK